MTLSVADSDGTKTEEGTMMSHLEGSANPAAVADPCETRNSTPATTKEGSDILINCRNCF
jgi:hypothetical protein